MPSAPLTTADGLEPGRIILVSKLLQPRDGGEPYWWKTFRVVLEPPRFGLIETVILRMDIDPDKDFRTEMLGEGLVVVTLEEHEVPQGPAAMLMKAITRGTIKIVPF